MTKHRQVDLEFFLPLVLREGCPNWPKDEFDCVGLTTMTKLDKISLRFTGLALAFDDYQNHPFDALFEVDPSGQLFSFIEIEIRGFRGEGKSSRYHAICDRGSTKKIE